MSGLLRIHRLILFGVMWVIPASFPASMGKGGTSSVLSLLTAFILGATLNAFADWFRFSWQVSGGESWIQVGSMRDPQLYFVALCLLAGLWMHPRFQPWTPFLATGTLILGVSFLLHAKLGSALALGVGLATLFGRMGRARLLVVFAAAVGLSLAVPAVLERVLDVHFDVGVGGRWALWTQAAPALLLEYPWGVGWCAVTHEMLAAHTVVQEHLNHLHCTPLQIALETGWPGLLLWFLWMKSAWTLMKRKGAWGPEEPGYVLQAATWGSFSGLLVNGLVEYNFGDTEILMLYGFLMGVGLTLIRKRNPGYSP